ncbi:ATP12 family protein [Acidisoma sp. 7E03]
MKRFWTETGTTRGAEGHVILLDGKPMRLPGGEVLTIAGTALAEAIAAEWRSMPMQAEVVPALLPLTQLAATTQFRIPAKRAETEAAIAAYGRSDLLCYRAAEPPDLVQRQQQLWQPWLDWATRRHDALLQVTRGIGFLEQPATSLAALDAAVAALDDAGLATLGVLVPLYGSLVLGLAVIDGALDAAEAYRLSVLDEIFQAERWGEDADAANRRAQKAAEAADAARYLALTRSG